MTAAGTQLNFTGDTGFGDSAVFGGAGHLPGGGPTLFSFNFNGTGSGATLAAGARLDITGVRQVVSASSPTSAGSTSTPPAWSRSAQAPPAIPAPQRQRWRLAGFQWCAHPGGRFGDQCHRRHGELRRRAGTVALDGAFNAGTVQVNSGTVSVEYDGVLRHGGQLHAIRRHAVRQRRQCAHHELVRQNGRFNSARMATLKRITQQSGDLLRSAAWPSSGAVTIPRFRPACVVALGYRR